MSSLHMPHARSLTWLKNAEVRDDAIENECRVLSHPEVPRFHQRDEGSGVHCPLWSDIRNPARVQKLLAQRFRLHAQLRLRRHGQVPLAGEPFDHVRSRRQV